MRGFTKKAVLVVVVLAAAGALFLNWERLGAVVRDVRGSDLPEPVAYTDTQEAVGDDETGEAALPAQDSQELSDPLAEETASVQNDDSAAPTEPSTSSDETAITAEYNLAVPFQPQAPYASWDLPYAEACEEASLIMADRFFKGASLSASQMDDAIKDLVAWQKNEFGYYEDAKASEVAVMWEQYFGGTVNLDYTVTSENIKRHLSENKLVIIPAAGRMLGNPYFSGEGPVYHMLVIRGYTKTHFITNDPGTKRGEAFLYPADRLISAIHDWPLTTGGDGNHISELQMEKGTPVLIVVDR